ncbi:MAG: cupin domain-containing protein [Verrucomicrobia bacterium]|nr:cupin domain-containing protein [Verrucomicrobiota bacterium]
MTHHLSFHQLKPQDQSEGGFRKKATKSNFPVLQNMSFYQLTLHPQAVREPHWHANADELGYCLKGKLLISFYGNNNTKETFIVSKGHAFFIPSGALHSLENIGNETAEAILQFSHEEPEDFGLSFVLGMFSDAVLGNTWDIPSSHFKALKRLSKESFIAKLPQPTSLSHELEYISPYQFALETSSPLISNEGGAARVARKNVWPVLQRQAVYSLRLSGIGMREPHWHPETAEMGYVAEGKGRMSILSPSGKIDTYEIEPGDLYFIPQAYPHHIENLTTSELHMLIFFDQPMPQDVGFTGSVKSFSNEVLSSVMQCKKEIFEELPTYYEDLFIVKKKNPQ